MNFEKTLFKISFLDTFKYFVLMLIFINVPILIFNLLKGDPKLLLYDTSWIIQFGYPIIFTTVQIIINRNGILKVTMFDDSKALTKRIESVVLKKGYTIDADANTGDIKYIMNSKLNRLFNTILNQNIEIKITYNEVSIFARKNMLDSIKMKLKFSR